MTDLLGNELNIGDKVVYAICNRDTKDLDYGIVTKISEKLCFCKSIIKPKYWTIAKRKYNQVIKVG